MAEKKDVPPPTASLAKEADWMIGMREHRTETGSYRRADVRRVLGSPWDRVDIQTDDKKPTSASLVTTPTSLG